MRKKNGAVSVWSCLIPRCFPRRASKSQTTCVMLSFKKWPREKHGTPSSSIQNQWKTTWEYSRIEIHCLCFSDLVSWSLSSFFVCNECSGPQCVTEVLLTLNMFWAFSLLFLCANSLSVNLPSTEFCKYTTQLWEGMVMGLCNLDPGTSWCWNRIFFFLTISFFFHHTEELLPYSGSPVKDPWARVFMCCRW